MSNAPYSPPPIRTKFFMGNQVSQSWAMFFNQTFQNIRNILSVPVTPPTPPGAIMDYGANTAPAGWLMCDGGSYSANTYAALYAVIGYTYGGSNGTFYVPDCRGRSSVGVGAGANLTTRTLNDKGGEETHVLVSGELAAHNHSINSNTTGISVNDPTHAHSYVPGGPATSVPNAPAQVAVNSSAAGTTTSANSTGISLTDNGHIHTSANTGSNTAHNTMHPYIVLNKIIKT